MSCGMMYLIRRQNDVIPEVSDVGSCEMRVIAFVLMKIIIIIILYDAHLEDSSSSR